MVYTDHRTSREDAIKEISNTLKESKSRLDGIGIHSEFLRTRSGEEVKMLVQRGNSQVKVEVNFVFRGTVLPTQERELTRAASELFTTNLSLPLLDESELYGSKLVAALDRQHPRDFFDVYGLFESTGLTPEIVECFVCYLSGHNRPIHEVLFSRDLDLSLPYESEFQGMTRKEVKLEELLSTRERLRVELPSRLTESQKLFLVGLTTGEPDWKLMECAHLKEMPAIRWKQENLVRLQKLNPWKFLFQSEELRRRLEM
jgi:predicted nucleotidyltransferase component of viral defense system